VAVVTAGLTIYDMCKAIDRGMVISDIHLVKKTGGKSGMYVRAIHESPLRLSRHAGLDPASRRS